MTIHDRACSQPHNSRSFLYIRAMVEVTQDPARWVIADTRVCCIQISARYFEKEDLRPWNTLIEHHQSQLFHPYKAVAKCFQEYLVCQHTKVINHQL